MKHITVVLLAMLVSSCFAAFEKRQVVAISGSKAAVPAVTDDVAVAPANAVVSDDDAAVPAAASNVQQPESAEAENVAEPAEPVDEDDVAVVPTVVEQPASNEADDDVAQPAVTDDSQPDNDDVAQPAVEDDDDVAPSPPESAAEDVVTASKSAEDVVSASKSADDVVSASKSAEDVVTASNSDTSSDVILVENYFLYDPEDMMQEFGAYGDYLYDSASSNQNGNGNSTSKIVQVAVLDNVIYFTSASTLIAQVESMLAYEESLFHSPTFDEYLENAPPADYEYFTLVKGSSKASNA